MAGIKNIIFDLGGVLLDISFEKIANAFTRLGVRDFKEMYSKNAANELFESIETANISNEDFKRRLQIYCRINVTGNDVENAWNSILIGFRKESIEYLSTLKNKYNIYLLSNTNNIHYYAIAKMFQQDFEGKKLEDFFVKSYFSHQIKMRKPYQETYTYVISNAGLNATETLLIDDSEMNIEGAKLAGLHTRLLLQNERIENIGL